MNWIKRGRTPLIVTLTLALVTGVGALFVSASPAERVQAVSAMGTGPVFVRPVAQIATTDENGTTNGGTGHAVESDHDSSRFFGPGNGGQKLGQPSCHISLDAVIDQLRRLPLNKRLEELKKIDKCAGWAPGHPEQLRMLLREFDLRDRPEVTRIALAAGQKVHIEHKVVEIELDNGATVVMTVSVKVFETNYGGPISVGELEYLITEYSFYDRLHAFDHLAYYTRDRVELGETGRVFATSPAFCDDLAEFSRFQREHFPAGRHSEWLTARRQHLCG